MDNVEKALAEYIATELKQNASFLSINELHAGIVLNKSLKNRKLFIDDNTTFTDHLYHQLYRSAEELVSKGELLRDGRAAHIFTQKYALAQTKTLTASPERLAYYRCGTSEVILTKREVGSFQVVERAVSEEDELPIYHITHHDTDVAALAEFKRTVGNLLG